MRAFLLLAGAAALAACGKDDQTGETINADQSLTANNIVVNDITAIDAVTGDAANMAADVDYTEALANLSNETGAEEPATGRAPRKAAPRPRRPAPEPATATPPANSAEQD